MQIIWLNSEATQTIDFIVSSSTQFTRQNCCSIISSVSPFLSVLTSGRIVVPLSLAAISLELFVDPILGVGCPGVMAGAHHLPPALSLPPPHARQQDCRERYALAAQEGQLPTSVNINVLQ
mmetsp:Transcript_20312/g.48844  ORF Transcript_20312/g.48844 Transcript_20312/m.48844 type:complete len:121 (+) Transcript_20312:1202-1564(+)